MEQIIAIATEPLPPASANWLTLQDWEQLNTKLRKELSLKACDGMRICNSHPPTSLFTESTVKLNSNNGDRVSGG